VTKKGNPTVQSPVPERIRLRLSVVFFVLWALGEKKGCLKRTQEKRASRPADSEGRNLKYKKDLFETVRAVDEVGTRAGGPKVLGRKRLNLGLANPEKTKEKIKGARRFLTQK